MTHPTVINKMNNFFTRFIKVIINKINNFFSWFIKVSMQQPFCLIFYSYNEFNFLNMY